MSRTSGASETGSHPASRGPRVVVLDVPSGMPAAVQLRDSLAKTLARGKSPVRVEVGTIGFPDVPVLQVLCAAHRRAVQRGVELQVTGDGAGSVTYLATLCGLCGPASCGIGDGATCPWANDTRDLG